MSSCCTCRTRAPARGHRSAGRAHRHDVLAFDHGAGACREPAQLKALATTGAKRSKFFPNVPTVAESGLPGYASVGWFGLLAPAHTPKDIVDKLNKAVVAIMGEQDVIDRMAKLGAEPEPQTPEEFGRFINADVAKWSDAGEGGAHRHPGGGEVGNLSCAGLTRASMMHRGVESLT